MFGQLLDIAAFFGMRDGDGAIADLYICNAIILEDRNIVFELIADQERFEQRTAEIDRKPIGLVDLDLFPQIRGDERSAKTQFDNIHMGMRHTQEILRLLDTQPFVHDHCNSMLTRLSSLSGICVSLKFILCIVMMPSVMTGAK